VGKKEKRVDINTTEYCNKYWETNGKRAYTSGKNGGRLNFTGKSGKRPILGPAGKGKKVRAVLKRISGKVNIKPSTGKIKPAEKKFMRRGPNFSEMWGGIGKSMVVTVMRGITLLWAVARGKEL